MKIFFAASTNQLKTQIKLYQQIISIIKASGNEILPTWTVDKIANKSTKKNSKEILFSNSRLLLESDCVIIEASTPSLGVGYMFGLAVSHRKPMLCLYQDEIENISDLVQGTDSHFVKAVKYKSADIKNVITDYLENVETEGLTKFNFVINQEVSDFINQGSKKENKSKSQFLRDLITNNFIHGSNSRS